jgi:hypothetical protein
MMDMGYIKLNSSKLDPQIQVSQLLAGTPPFLK